MKVMANSIPKGGTHLLLRLIELLGFDADRFWVGADLVRGRAEVLRKLRKGSYSNNVIAIGSEVPVNIGAKWLEQKLSSIPNNAVYGAHCQYTPELAGLLDSLSIKPLCIVRDPRSIAVSHLDYIKRSPGHFFHKAYMSLPDDDARLDVSINGGQLGKYKLESLGYRYQHYTNWASLGGALFVKFEDLVGEKGGSNDQAQAAAIKAVDDYLQLDSGDSWLKQVASQLFGDTSTFRKGQIDSWKTELSPFHKKAILNNAGEILLQLGYETDNNWVDQ